MNLNLVFSRKYRWPEHYFSVCCMGLGISHKLLATNQFLVCTIFFTNINISFFNLRFDLFLIIAKKVNQIRNNVVCVVAHLVFVFFCALTTGLCFSAYFRKLKEIGVLRPIFLGYFISSDYNITGWYLTPDYQYLVKTINILMLKRQNANPKHF